MISAGIGHEGMSLFLSIMAKMILMMKSSGMIKSDSEYTLCVLMVIGSDCSITIA